MALPFPDIPVGIFPPERVKAVKTHTWPRACNPLQMPYAAIHCKVVLCEVRLLTR